MIGYYFITDSNLTKDGIFEDVKIAIKAGARFVQYRRKNVNTKVIYDEAYELRKICQSATFIINDRVDIAQAVDADGVHLGSTDMPYFGARKIIGMGRIIGCTVHDLAGAIHAEQMGVNYLGVGPIFQTQTKEDYLPARGIELITAVRKSCRIPIVAIGGISIDNAQSVIDSGANMICAISDVYNAEDMGAQINKYQALYNL
jgi:thiamine-phosphate pyrophosphorylase